MAETSSFDESFALRTFVPQLQLAYLIDIGNYELVYEKTQLWLSRQTDDETLDHLSQMLSQFGYH
jgi:hypothetical protein